MSIDVPAYKIHSNLKLGLLMFGRIFASIVLLITLVTQSLADDNIQSQCEAAIDKSTSTLFPKVKFPNCVPLDPTCKKVTAESMGLEKTKQQNGTNCAKIAKANCAEYSHLISKGVNENTAWDTAMHHCGKSINSIDIPFFNCMCRKEIL